MPIKIDEMDFDIDLPSDEAAALVEKARKIDPVKLQSAVQEVRDFLNTKAAVASGVEIALTIAQTVAKLGFKMIAV